MTIMVRSI